MIEDTHIERRSGSDSDSSSGHTFRFDRSRPTSLDTVLEGKKIHTDRRTAPGGDVVMPMSTTSISRPATSDRSIRTVRLSSAATDGGTGDRCPPGPLNETGPCTTVPPRRIVLHGCPQCSCNRRGGSCEKDKYSGLRISEPERLDVAQQRH